MESLKVLNVLHECDSRAPAENPPAPTGQEAEALFESEKALAAAANIIKKKTALLQARHMDHLKRLSYLESVVSEKDRVIRQREDSFNKLVSGFCAVEPMNASRSTGPVRASVSIVIPVRDGGDRLRRCLDRVGRQRKVDRIELIVIDSGSVDGSVDVARSHGAKVIQIPSASFNHGATRQLGVHHASGEYVIYTVEDAVPSSDYWLFKVVAAFEANPDLSVITIRQLVTEDADLYSRWTNEAMYEAYGLTADTKYFMESPDLFDLLPEPIKRRMSFVDDVCACYRKESLLRYGFTSIANGEDVDIGARMARAGERLGFLHTAGVYHWHSRGPAYFLKRNYNGAKTFVDVLAGELPNFETLCISSIDDILRRSWVLYHAIRLALLEWEPGAEASIDDIGIFLGRFNDVVDHYPCRMKKAASDVGGDPEMRALLDGLSGKAFVTATEGNLFRYNHLVLNFSEDLRRFLGYCVKRRGSIRISKEAFGDVLFKIAGGLIGNALGYWYMHLKKGGHGDEMSRVDLALAKGICFR